jgi:hypothetical protein
MASLIHQRCFNHAVREAVARCPECGRFFCRECIAEHDGRVVCSTCLQKLAHAPARRRPAWLQAWRVAQFGAGLLLAWFVFFLLGTALLRIPAAFHDGTLWHVK